MGSQELSMAYREDTITVRGRHIRLLRGGSGPSLLYLHDTFCPTWRPVHDRLARQSEVIFPIHPGCAGSEGFEDIDSMDDLLFHYLDVCETLQLDKPVLLGASLGGWLAAEWAVRYADRLGGVILVDALGLRLPEAPAVDILRLDAAQTRAVVFAEPTSDLAHELVPEAPSPAALAAILQARQTLARFAWQFPDNPKLSRYLYRVRLPTLIIWGQNDGVVPPAHGKGYQDGMANAELVVIPACGHLPHVEQPEAFLQAVEGYLDRQWKRAPSKNS
jgi:pimeloyl-ACP methyl ester carboxylesterase